MGPGVTSWLRRKRYKRVFFLASLEAYEQTAMRMESHPVAMRISAQVREACRLNGYELVMVPTGPVADRVAFIVSHIA